MSGTAEPTTASDATVGRALSLIDLQLQQFRGSEDPRIAVTDFLREEAARRETELAMHDSPVVSEDEGSIVASTVRPICDYLLLIIKIGQAMCDEVGKEFPGGEVRVVQVRTSFDFVHWFVKVLFVVDADPERELRFSQMANDLERIVLVSDSFAAELDYVNKRRRQLDLDSLRQRYPFVAKVRTAN